MALTFERVPVSVNGRTQQALVVRTPLVSCRMRVALAGGRIGLTEPLEGIARREKALAAINGCFFDAYVAGSPKLPWHNLMRDGELLHIGNTGTTLAWTDEGVYSMEPAKAVVRGAVVNPGGPGSWYAYLVNHPGGAALYTARWFKRTAGGDVTVCLAGGRVVSIASGEQTIPPDGAVLSIGPSERGMASRFKPGAEVDWRAEWERVDRPDWWRQARQAIGCGPRLVSRGQTVDTAVGEGFRDRKILSAAGARSAIGLTASGDVLLVCASGTIAQMAQVMVRLGAVDAMNLDGGASSCLWVNGRYARAPGRDISNALCLLPV